jgi:hypothetical protein
MFSAVEFLKGYTMKKLGYLLIAIGFLVGSLAAITNTEVITGTETVTDNVDWNFFLPAIIVGIIGIVIVRVHDHRHSRSEEKLTGHLSDIENSLAAIVKNVTTMCDNPDAIDTYQVHKKIDEIFRADLMNFVDARTAISHVYGMQEYADVMSYFASAERAINRAWSASTDGYVNEVKISLQKAKDHFSTVQEKMNYLKQQSA